MTWFDGHPAHLWQYPAAEEGSRYVECMGGVDPLCDKAEQFIAKGDSRFAATLLAHAVAAYPGEEENSARARSLLAKAYEILGYGAENATWRNFYLTGAQELRTGKKAGMLTGGKTPLGPNLSVDQWFDVMSVQLDGERAAEDAFAIDFEVEDVRQRWRLIVSNGVLTRRLVQFGSQESSEPRPNLHMKLTRLQLLDVLRGKEVDVAKDGDVAVLNRLLDLISVRKDSERGPSQL